MSTIPMPACPAGSVQQQVMQQYSYLFQMVQQLNLALEGLRQESGTGSGGGKDTAQQYRRLRTLITAVEQRLRRTAEELAARLETEYVAADDFGDHAAELSARLEAEPRRLGEYYGFAAELREAVEAVESAFTQYRENAACCIRAGIVRFDREAPVYGVAVGQGLTCREADGEQVVEPYGFRAVFTDQGLSLWQDDTEVARVADGRLRLCGTAAAEGADVGGWRVTDDADGLTFRWIGG